MKENALSFSSQAVTDSLGQTFMKVSVTDEHGMLTEKTLAMDDYISLLTGSTFQKMSKMLRIGTLPEHYYDGSLSANDDGFRVILHYPACKRAISFGGKHWFVPFPNLIFFFQVKNGAVTQKYCFAVPTADITSETPLFRYPFGNVGSDGGICFGNISLKIGSIQHIEEACNAFFESVTNNDYYTEIAGMKQEKLLKKLSKLDVYPNEWLLGTSEYEPCSTISDLEKKLFI